MRRLICILLMLSALPLSAQVDRKEVREGNRKFRKGDFKNSEIDYRRAVVKDSLSVAGEYNLASALYRQQNYDEAGKALEAVKDVAPAGVHAADYYYNMGDVALQKKDYGAAVKAFKESLLSRTSKIKTRISRTRTRIRTKIRIRTRTSRISRISSRRYLPSRHSRCYRQCRPRKRRLRIR